MRTHSTAVAFQQNTTHQNLKNYKPVQRPSSLINMFVAAVLAALDFVSAQAHAAAPQGTELKGPNTSSATTATRVYTIAPQPVSSALKAFATQSDMQLIYTESDVGETQTAGINGKLTPDEALARMLQGTDLQFQFTASNVIVITYIPRFSDPIFRQFRRAGIFTPGERRAAPPRWWPCSLRGRA